MNIKEDIRKEINNYLSLTKEEKIKLLKKIGADKDVSRLRKAMEKQNMSFPRKVIRAISEDTREIIASNLKTA